MEIETSIRKKFPREIAIGLIVISLVVSLAPLLSSSNTWMASITINLATIFILMPLLFVLIGLVQKFRDRTFNLWNMYYLGVLVGLILNLRNLLG